MHAHLGPHLGSLEALHHAVEVTLFFFSCLSLRSGCPCALLSHLQEVVLLTRIGSRFCAGSYTSLEPVRVRVVVSRRSDTVLAVRRMKWHSLRGRGTAPCATWNWR